MYEIDYEGPTPVDEYLKEAIKDAVSAPVVVSNSTQPFRWRSSKRKLNARLEEDGRVWLANDVIEHHVNRLTEDIGLVDYMDIEINPPELPTLNGGSFDIDTDEIISELEDNSTSPESDSQTTSQADTGSLSLHWSVNERSEIEESYTYQATSQSSQSES